MLSLAKPHQYYQIFLAQGIGMGIGMGLLFLPAISVTSHYFRKRRAAAMGVVLSGKYLTYFTCTHLTSLQARRSVQLSTLSCLITCSTGAPASRGA
jgi:hypothetical protein